MNYLQSFWYGSYHYALCVKPKSPSGVNEIRLFEHLEDALREAKFALWNNEAVSVLSLGPGFNFTGEVLYASKTTKQFIDCRTDKEYKWEEDKS